MAVTGLLTGEIAGSHRPIGVDEAQEDEDGHGEQHVLPVLLPKQLELLFWEEVVLGQVV